MRNQLSTRAGDEPVGKSKAPSLESIQQRANNILTRLEQIEESTFYLANGPQDIDKADKKDALLEDTNILRIDETLGRVQGFLVSIENNLSKLRYG